MQTPGLRGPVEFVPVPFTLPSETGPVHEGDQAGRGRGGRSNRGRGRRRGRGAAPLRPEAPIWTNGSFQNGLPVPWTVPSTGELPPSASNPARRGRGRPRRRGRGAGPSRAGAASDPAFSSAVSDAPPQRGRGRGRRGNAATRSQNPADAGSTENASQQSQTGGPSGPTFTPSASDALPQRGRGRGRGRRGNSVARSQQPADATSTENASQPQDRSRGRGRGRRRNGRSSRSNSRPSGAVQESAPDSSGLHVPNRGDVVAREPQSSGNTPTTELATKLANLLNRGEIECVICLERVRRGKEIWTCDVCFAVVHLPCAKKWATQSVDGEPNFMRLPLPFPCPSCRSMSGNTLELLYTCFCGARVKPELMPGLTPGSCGGICGKIRGQRGSNCIHTCTELCHPGPCPPCTLLDYSVKCHCGKTSIERKCGDPIPREGVSCGAICGKPLPGCLHPCTQPCHAGPCDECMIPVDLTCGCGKTTTALPCVVAQQGFVCGAVCGKVHDCGKHSCQRKCHEGECGPCPQSPSQVHWCACGRRPLTEVSNVIRTSCTDPIPSCGGPCLKPLGCVAQHQCQEVCGHDGDCPKCTKTVSAECRCGQSVKAVQCGLEGSELRAALVCDKTCNDRLSCRKHRCREICCPHRRRKVVHKKGSSIAASGHLWTDPEYGTAESAHQCRENCNQMLSCGLHTCDLPCGHRGPCPPCGLLLREPITCACGAATTPVPVRCGTPPPKCNLPCSRPKPCGHPCTEPTCHEGECPKCVELLQIDCVGKHGVLRFVPCHIGASGIKCHRSCGRTLKCGIHGCRKPCHSLEDEDCEESFAEGCNQICGLPRACGHGCGEKCHPERRCPDVPCQVPITVTCPCGIQQQKAPCLRGGRNMPLGSTGNVRLVCTDDCRSQQRLVAFANAVGKMSTTETFADSNVLGKPTSYSGFLMRFATEDLSAVEFFEKELGTIVMGRTKKVTFRSLPKLHRMVVHELAEEYNMVSESSGKEPNRHIVVSHRGAGFKPTAPRPLLSEAYFSKKKEAMNIHRSPLSKSLIIHVASLSRIHGSADITTRVERELKMHSGFFVVVRKETMKNSNLTGVLVRFSTRERMEMARTALSVKSGISVQSFDAVVGAAEASAAAAAPVAASVVATPWSTSETSGAGPSRPEKTEPAPAPVQNVPDSWEDD